MMNLLGAAYTGYNKSTVYAQRRCGLLAAFQAYIPMAPTKHSETKKEKGYFISDSCHWQIASGNRAIFISESFGPAFSSRIISKGRLSV